MQIDLTGDRRLGNRGAAEPDHFCMESIYIGPSIYGHAIIGITKVRRRCKFLMSRFFEASDAIDVDGGFFPGFVVLIRVFYACLAWGVVWQFGRIVYIGILRVLF